MMKKALLTGLVLPLMVAATATSASAHEPEPREDVEHVNTEVCGQFWCHTFEVTLDCEVPDPPTKIVGEETLRVTLHDYDRMDYLGYVVGAPNWQDSYQDGNRMIVRQYINEFDPWIPEDGYDYNVVC